ncbi:Uncharacterized protein FWK35_00033486, partial [Aphis craccivora]
MTLENNFSRVIDIDVFGSSQSSETKKKIFQIPNNRLNRFRKIEHLVELSYKSNIIQEEKTEKLEL